jgi:predicted Zn-ribbon and HTH transcriptional regulator
MNIQANLFGANVYGDLVPLVRRSDPETSHRAAAKQRARGKIDSQSATITSILRRAGRPCTYREIWTLANETEKAKLIEANTIAKRLTTMQRRGIVQPGVERVCSVSNNAAREWQLAPEKANRFLEVSS